MRLGWFRPVHCKSIEAQETRAVLTARKLLQSKLRDIENSLRGVLRGFGLKVGKTTECTFAARIGSWWPVHPRLELVAKALLEAHAVLRREFNGLDKHTQKLARAHPPARLLMTTPSVGPIVALTYAAAIDDPKRFRSSKTTGAHFGLTPEKTPVGAKRLHRPHQQDRRCLRAGGTLSSSSRHADQANQGLLGAEELGDADLQARGHAQGQGGTGAQARRYPASDAC
jgi:transposase